MNTISIFTTLVNNVPDTKKEGLDIVVINNNYILLLPGTFIKDNVQVQITNAYIIYIPFNGYQHVILMPMLATWSTATEVHIKITQNNDNNGFMLASINKTNTNLEVINL